MKKHDKKLELVETSTKEMRVSKKMPEPIEGPSVEMKESRPREESDPISSCPNVTKKMSEQKPKGKRKPCCVKGCTPKNGNIGVHSYHFPSDRVEWKQERRRKWIEAVIKYNKLEDGWEPNQNHTICSAHFAGGKKSEHPLHPAYNPTIFPGQSSVKANKAAARFQRCLNRSLNKPPIINKCPTECKKAKPLTQVEDSNCQQNQQQPQNEISDGNVKEIFKTVSRPRQFKDFGCQVFFRTPLNESQNNMVICNLGIENGINYAETQTVLHENIPKDGAKNSTKEGKLLKNVFVHNVQFNGISSIHYDHELLELSGVNFTLFNHLLKQLPDIVTDHVSKANKLLIFLMILKQGISNSVAAVLFQLSHETVCKLFANVLLSLTDSLNCNIRWPETGGYSFNEPLMKTYPNFKAILTCTEIQTEMLSSGNVNEVTNTTQECETFRVLLSHSPNGFVSYASESFDGMKSLGLIIEKSNFLNQIKCNDMILADDSFLITRDLIESKQGHLTTSSFTKDSVKTYIKNCNCAMKRFRILSYLPMELKMCLNNIIQVCCSLINLSILFDKQKSKV